MTESNQSATPPRRGLGRRRRSRYLLGKVGGPIAFAFVMLVAPYEASAASKVALAVLLLIVAAALTFVDRRFEDPKRHVAVAVVNCGGAVIAAAVAPSLWFVIAVSLSALCTTHLMTGARQYLWRIVTVSFGALAAVAMFITDPRPDNWLLAIASGVTIIVGSAFWLRESDESRLAREESHSRLLDRTRAFSWEADLATGEILEITGNIQGVLGHEAEEFVGRPMQSFAGRQKRLRVWSVGEERHAMFRVTHRDGHDVILHEVRVTHGDDGIVGGILSDVTEANQAIEALEYRANHDALTDLPNRTSLRATAKATLSEATGETALLIADLDRFKEVNDTLGHLMGDQLLGVLANRFRNALGDDATVARIGGDEFAFLVPDANPREARRIAEHIRSVAAAPVEIDGFTISTSASIGIAIAPGHATTYDELLKCSDIACYSAKHVGGGIRQFDSVPEKMTRRRLRLLTEMPQAIANGEFELFLQPKVSIRDRQVVGAEGLARWRHPELGLLYPGDFLHAIDLASDYQRFTNEMIRQAIDFAATVQTRGREINVAVNLGTMSLRDEGLPNRVKAMLDLAGIDGSWLTFEVVESDLVPSDPFQQQIFSGLIALGIRVSIDDFGTGYSNFSQLKSLSADEIKIDRSFVQELDKNPTDLAIVQAMVDLTRKLGYSVVAEGVEQAAQAEMLVELGCDLAQGYHYGRPMPQAEFLEGLLTEKLLDENDHVAPKSTSRDTSVV